MCTCFLSCFAVLAIRRVIRPTRTPHNPEHQLCMLVRRNIQRHADFLEEAREFLESPGRASGALYMHCVSGRVRSAVATSVAARLMLQSMIRPSFMDPEVITRIFDGVCVRVRVNCEFVWVASPS